MWGKWCQTHIAENIVPHCKALVLPLRGWKEKMMFLILSIRCSWQLNTFLLVWIWVCLSHTHTNSRSFRSAVIFFFTDTCLRWRALMGVLFVHSELIWFQPRLFQSVRSVVIEDLHKRRQCFHVQILEMSSCQQLSKVFYKCEQRRRCKRLIYLGFKFFGFWVWSRGELGSAHREQAVHFGHTVTQKHSLWHFLLSLSV